MAENGEWAGLGSREILDPKNGEVGVSTPPGNPDGCENKAVAGKAIRIVVKTKDEQNSIPQRRGTVEATGGN